MTADPGRCDVCGHELVETEDQQGHPALGCPLCHAQRQAQVWRGEWEKVCKELAEARAAAAYITRELCDSHDSAAWLMQKYSWLQDELERAACAAGGEG